MLGGLLDVVGLIMVEVCVVVGISGMMGVCMCAFVVDVFVESFVL